MYIRTQHALAVGVSECIDGCTFRWTSNRDKALRINYSNDSLLFGEISNIKDSLQEEYYKKYDIIIEKVNA